MNSSLASVPPEETADDLRSALEQIESVLGDLAERRLAVDEAEAE